MKNVLNVALAALAAASAAAFAQVPAGYPADYAQTVAAAKKEGKVVVYSALDTKAAQPAHQGLQRALSRRQGRVQRHELDRALQPLHRRGRLGPGLGRRDVELGDGPAGEAGRRRQGARVQVARGGEAAVVGELQGPGVRHDLRAHGLHLQQAPGHRRRDPAGPRVVREDHQRATSTSSRARSPPTTSRRAAWASCSWCRTRSTSRA